MSGGSSQDPGASPARGEALASQRPGLSRLSFLLRTLRGQHDDVKLDTSMPRQAAGSARGDAATDEN